MKDVELVVGVDPWWNIGNKGELLIHSPLDMKRFKRETQNKVLVQGLATLRSYPHGGATLKGRPGHIILAGSEPDFTEKDVVRGDDAPVVVVHSLEECLAEMKHQTEDLGHEIAIVGGALVYRLLFPYCDKLVITKFLNERKWSRVTCDATMLNIDNRLDEWYVDSIAGPFEDPDYRTKSSGGEDALKFEVFTYKKRPQWGQISIFDTN